ncbi:hypothetical protein JAAARDRAFT_68289 [Jaapia argillacea MUCL 33604]|uniref:RBR-type E3 ubiquitin transferase n=1 Tax=Jaapia argillacea MUCL 33604 TaxID=933084 RepID=A0A067Q0L4_9AGAM|nr:hypothetical protein JAAARDRAFT_68289 [Jaapia argillacea MUCL 33604]
MSDYSGGSDDGYDFDDDDFPDDDGSDFGSSSAKDKGKKPPYELNYESLSVDSLQAKVLQDIQDLAAVIGSEPPIVSILLRHFRWNKDRLIDRYMESPTEVLKDAGEPVVKAVPRSHAHKRPRLRSNTSEDPACGICFDTPTLEETFQLRCQHRFCTACWEIYVKGKIMDEGQCTIKCMQDGCQTVLDEPSITKLVDQDCHTRYQKLLLESYVAAHPSLRFCPSPGCTETVSCTSVSKSTLLTIVPTVGCAKSHLFCFGCGMDSDHRPIVCQLAAIWLKNAREDAGTSQWIKANTRNCPKCQQNIEKSGGCKHCNYMFCWLCMQKWEVHGYNDSVCNTWKEPPADDSMTEAKRNLDKWLFYFDRFNNHELSANLDEELVERTADKVVEIQEASQLSWIEAKFMDQAVEELTKCRRTLKWSYAMAHFLVSGNKKQMFEDIQADLEKAVEELSQMLEEPIEAETVKSLRQRMIDKTVYVQKRHEILRQDTANGLLEGTWEWTINLE